MKTMNQHPPTKLWTRVPGTGYPTWKPETPLTYMMGSYTATANYCSAWDHKGHLTYKVRHYTVAGPGMLATLTRNLAEAKQLVKRHLNQNS